VTNEKIVNKICKEASSYRGLLKLTGHLGRLKKISVIPEQEVPGTVFERLFF
jgi:hypothetical protein